MKRLIWLLAPILLCAVTTAAQAKVYRWVDDNGNVHYGSQPPSADSQAEEIKVRAPKPASPGEQDQSDQPESDSGNEYSQRLLKACEDARKNYEAFANPANKRFKTEDGEIVEFTDEERAAKLQEAEQQVEAFCQDEESEE